MSKNRKKLIIILAAAIAVIVGAVVSIILFRNYNISVYVQQVEYLNENYLISDSSLSGTITESAEQRIYQDSAAAIDEVYVKTGDKVKKNDKLFKYNTDIIELNIREKELSVEIYENELSKLNKKLSEYEAIEPVSPDATEAEDERTDTPAETIDESADDAPLPDDSLEDIDDSTDDSEEPEVIYTEDEKAELIASTKREISEMENNLGIANNELNKAKLELNEAIVRATVTGKVIALQDKKKINKTEPFCVIAGDTGVKLEGYLSEFDLDNTKVGDTVQVTSWMSGGYTEAQIQEIDSYPAEGIDLYRDGNQNTSYYRFTAFMDDAAGFTIGEEVEIRKDNDADLSAIVLPKLYVKSDSDGAFVMIDDGQGRLKKQYVTTQKCSQSDYVIISDGLTTEDLIAFPYGDGLIEGTKTTEEYRADLL